jgi:hypothetical protein
MPLIFALLDALLLTCIAESAVLAFCRPRKLWLTMGLLCNIATNPLLNILRLAASVMLSASELWMLTVLLEIAVVFAEAGLYRLGTAARFCICLRRSLLCNAASLGMGLLIGL